MKKNICSVCCILMIMMLFNSCSKSTDTESQKVYAIGLVGGIGGFNDHGFNENILAGLNKAAAELPITCEKYECATSDDVKKGIEFFLSKRFDLIITSGFDAATATTDAAKANIGTDFLIIDYAMANPPANLLCAVFDVDQSSFPCGFLAAYWANRQNSANAMAGFVAGPNFPEIRQFSSSYVKGIAYFNTLYSRNVQWAGYFATSFTDTLQGANLADSLMKQNASVIFVFAGNTGKGALYKVKAGGKWAIGVDVDQYYSIPQVGSVLLTSCMKDLDEMVHSVIKQYSSGSFPGGTVTHGTLANNGIGMAPFHDFATSIPDSIKAELTAIETKIKNGSLLTGWPE